ncbi:hypothetical protein GCM10027289_11190 [Tsukamurella serpentis]
MTRDPGFTGVDWYSRTTERLAADLLGGAGPQPLSTAAQETARLASAYGEAATRLDALVVRLDGAVDTGRTDSSARRTGPLPEYARWLAGHAADLAEYAAKLSAQAGAYEVAARAMPDPAEAVRMRIDRENAQAAAAAGGGVPASAALIGAAADSERAEQLAHGEAAAVMVGFERAAEPLRAAWEFTPPPKTQLGRGKGRDRPRGPGAGSKAGRGGGFGAGAPAAPMSAFPVTALHRDQSAAVRPTVSSGAPSAGQRGMPMMPAGMMGAGAGAALKNGNHTPGATASETDDGPEAFIVHAAPSVLGDHADAEPEQS